MQGQDSRYQQGYIVKHKPQEGYAFIRPQNMPDNRDDVYLDLHYVIGGARLWPGRPVTYRTYMAQRGLAARDVTAGSALAAPHVRFGLLAAGIAATLLVASALLLGPRSLPEWVLLWLFACSMASFLLYRYDKYQAESGQIRAPEIVLHVLDAVGGAPGGFIGMHWPTHHKTAKPAFKRDYMISAAVCAGLLIVLLIVG